LTADHPDPEGQFLPLSIEQEWFLAQRIADPGARISIVTGSVIRGHLDTDRFLTSLADVVARHEGLRTRIAFTKHGEPRQTILPPESHPPPVTCQTVASRSYEQFEAYARALARRDLSQRWDPVDRPMYHLWLLRRSPREHIFISTFDHLGFDARAVDIFDGDLWDSYCDSSKEASVPHGAGLTLSDSVTRQLARFGRRAATVSAAYWASKFRLAPPVVQLAGARHALKPTTGERRQRAYIIDAAVVQRLDEVCLASGCSRFQILTAIFCYLAFSLTLQDRLPVYVPVDCRERAAANVIGNFAGVRLLILRRSQADSVASLLAEVRREALRAFAHRHLDYQGERPILSGQRARWGLAPQRQLAVNYLRATRSRPTEREWGGLQVRPMQYVPRPPTQRMALGLNVSDGGDDLWVEFEYSADMLSDDLILGLIQRFDGCLRDGILSTATGQVAAVQPVSMLENRCDPAEASRLSPLHWQDGTLCMHADTTEIRAALLSHPAVVEAHAWVARHDDGGSEVVARVGVTAEIPEEILRQACLDWPQATQYMIPPARIEQVVVPPNRTKRS
jgi:hypothetical protein